MIAQSMKKILSGALSLVLTGASSQLLFGFQNQAQGTNTGNPTDTIPQSTAELQALVAPIALYPDSLVAQVLSASTFPDQVAIANYWLQQNSNLAGQALMKQSRQTVVGSKCKGTHRNFLLVLDDLAKNLTWTSSLGEAYHNQQADVMSAIQTLRAQAKAAGNLKSSSQITVVQQSPQTIVIQPANPQIVYVPEYNPALIYGYPYVVPGYTPGYVAAAGIIGFRAGIAVGAMMSGGCCSWGYSSWNCGWHGGTAVVYHGAAYNGNSAWHGGYYNNGYHSSYGYNNSYNNAYNHSNTANNFKNNGNTYNKNVSGNTVNVNTKNAQNSNVNRSSAYNAWGQHSGGDGANSNAFSGMSGHSGGFGNSGGWSSRAESSRGWGSMSSSGFGGGRFGGGGGGFGRGGFGGVGRR